MGTTLRDSTGTFYALNATSGVVLWSTSLGSSILNSPTFANGVVYVSDGDLFVLNAANGTILWAHSFGNWNYSSPVVVNGIVYFTSQDGNMYAFHS
jgi:outer membrane protein assembly factor BamB